MAEEKKGTQKMIKKTFKFRQTKNNGTLGGTNQEYLVPEFNWDEFKNLPSAELFVRRVYDSQVQKIVRDILLVNGKSSGDNLQSIESVITRSLSFTKKDIEDWCKERNWEEAPLKGDREKAIQYLTEHLPMLAVNDAACVFNKEGKERAANIIAEISDRKTDDISEYLWLKLTEVIAKLPKHTELTPIKT